MQKSNIEKSDILLYPVYWRRLANMGAHDRMHQLELLRPIDAMTFLNRRLG
jgi:hypothetical protein